MAFGFVEIDIPVLLSPATSSCVTIAAYWKLLILVCGGKIAKEKA
jgi:hypothetical protein